ncbi:hypothetical protein EJB05_30282 [Eragrostis curvula]|uniref:Uncharacterized protein n=1 Tax=Eragrostis curvula TaxID=38414 RepID=A0A5J9UHH6_9POAL|nr:hypothetical protein EJB05_30282 [Eragrostis curvula]
MQRWFQDNFKQACAGDPALMVCAGWICGERRAVDYHVRLVTIGSIEESSGMTKLVYRTIPTEDGMSMTEIIIRVLLPYISYFASGRSDTDGM